MDVRPAQWLLDRLDPLNFHCVGSIVPKGFERYARIFHPGRRFQNHQQIPVRWAEVAAWTGRHAHALMQWEAIAGSLPHKAGVESPDEGTLPVAVSAPLRDILCSQTVAERCWLAVWVGWGWDYRRGVPDNTGSFETPWREWDLFRAPLKLMDTVFYDAHTDKTANMVWPDDRSWLLATEIDLNTSYIGGSAPLIQALMASQDLEIWPVAPDDSVTVDSDTLNSASRQ